MVTKSSIIDNNAQMHNPGARILLHNIIIYF
jgi:hypothetical protein